MPLPVVGRGRLEIDGRRKMEHESSIAGCLSLVRWFEVHVSKSMLETPSHNRLA